MTEHALEGSNLEGGRSRHLVVTVLGLGQILAWGSSYYLPAVLAAPIAAETGWSLAWVVGGLSLGLVAAGLVSPFVGARIGRGFGREVLAGSAVLLSAGLLCVGLAASLPFYLAGWVVIGVGMGAGLYDAAFATLGTFYGQAARRTITALTLFGGFASTVCWPLSAYLLEHFGWRGACLIYAGIQIAVVLPAYWLLLPPYHRGLRTSLPSGVVRSTSLIDPDKRASFLLLGATISLAALISTTLSVHLLTVLQATGMTLGAAVALGAIVGPSQVCARIVDMLFGPRYHPIWTKLAATSLVLAGIILLWNGPPLLALGLILYGCGIGIESIARGALPLAMFGADGYGARMGRLAMPSLVAQAVAPFLGAILLQMGDIPLTLLVLTGLAATNVMLVLLLRGIMRSSIVKAFET